MRKAVIDVGSNSVLLLVEELDGSQWRTLTEASFVTSLGEGTKSTGILSEDAMTRTLQALAQCFAIASSFGVDSVRAAATMAARIATNTAEFQRRAGNQGTPVEILSGDEEARLGFESVAFDPALPKQCDRLAIIDPGGHSTEILVASRDGSGWRTEFLNSYPIGTLGLLSQGLPEGVCGPQEILAASDRIDTLLESTPPPEVKIDPVYVLGATGTNLISIRERLAEWNPSLVHGAILEYEEVGRAVGWLMSLTVDERVLIVGMESGRERTIAAGTLILERCLYALKSEACVVSVRGWRHAMLERSA